MICGTIENWRDELDGTETLEAAFGWLQEVLVRDLPDGKYTIDGDRLFAMVQRYTTQPIDEGRLEAHRKYMDIQILLSGEELMLYTEADGLDVDEAYDDEKDLVFFHTPLGREIHSITVPANSFVIFPPEDAHMPGRQSGDNAEPVTKIVVKVRVDD